MRRFPRNTIDGLLELEAVAPETPDAALIIAWKRLAVRDVKFLGREEAA